MRSDAEWIKSLKVGDIVAIPGHWDVPDSPAKVTAITPSGRVRLDNGCEYNPDGRRRGSSGYSWLEPWTPEKAEKLRRYKLVNRLAAMDRSYNGSRTWKDLTMGQLERIAAIIDEPATAPSGRNTPPC